MYCEAEGEDAGEGELDTEEVQQNLEETIKYKRMNARKIDRLTDSKMRFDAPDYDEILSRGP